MKRIIKANVQARHASLCDGSFQVSLFNINNIDCNATYLEQNQTYTGSMNHNQTVLLVTQGSGELTCNDGTESMTMQVITGDILYLPEKCSYTMLNVAAEMLTFIELFVKA